MTRYANMTEEQKKADHERSKRWRRKNKKKREYKPLTEAQKLVRKERQTCEEVKQRKRETYALRKAGISSPRYGPEIDQSIIDTALDAIKRKKKIVLEQPPVVVEEEVVKVVVERKPKPLSKAKQLELRCLEIEKLWDQGLCPCGCQVLSFERVS